MKKALLSTLLYIATMGAGMYYVKSTTGIGYSDEGFLDHFLWILLGLAVATSLYALVFKKETTLPIKSKANWKPYMIIMLPIIVALIVAASIAFTPTWSFFVPIIATLFVGIAEETMFRKILFNVLLKRAAHRGGTIIGAILLSALAFSLLHAVNVLGGQSVGAVAIQLVLTFFVGILFAVLYIQTKSLPALIAFHWLWDALTFMKVEKQLPAIAILLPALTVMQIIMGLVMLKKYKGVKASELLKGAK